MKSYETHTGLVLQLQEQDGTYLVTLTGDQAKVLYAGKDATKANAMYDETEKHYEERKAAETTPAI